MVGQGRPKILVFFPQNPYPPRSGAHQRCLEMLRALIDLNYDVILLSSENFSETPWEAASVAWLRELGVQAVHVYRPPAWIAKGKAALAKVYWAFNRRAGKSPTVAVDSAWFSPPGMRRWFAALARAIRPDAVLMNYAYWDGLLDAVRDLPGVRIIDTLDLVSHNTAMRLKLEPLLPRPLRVETTPDAIVREDFFTRLALEASPKEFAIYDRYEHTLAISPHEATTIAKRAPRTTVHYTPMTQRPVALTNTYDGPALYAASTTALNIQGYLYFVKRVLPLVRREVPDLVLHVTGGLAKALQDIPMDGVVLRGFVPDLAEEYARASFAICPLIGRTGQQIKIVEAMAHGVPVVALRATAEGSPIEHGVSGFVADNAEEFARYVLRLWRDRVFCAKLGSAARARIAAEYAPDQLKTLLVSLIPRG